MGVSYQAGAAPAASSLTVIVGSDVVALHPSDASDAASESILLNIYEPLVYMGDAGKIQPLLAESWQVVDETTYRFKLRDNIKFHNGQPLTADDVAGSINELLKPANGRPYRNGLFTVNIKEAVKEDARSVLIRTTVPFGPFLRNVAQLRIVPSRVSREELSKRTVGSGPYRVTEHVEGSHFTMERFDQYWGPKPSIARVTFRIVPEASARVAEIQAGRADIVMPLVPELVPVVERTQGYKVVQAPTTYRIAMTYNTRLDTPVRNPKVRQALNHAINHDAIIRNVLGGFGRKSGPLIEQDLGYNRFFKDFPYDPAKARALLAEAGFPNGFSVVLATSQGRYVKDKEVSEAIAGMYREVGVNARVQVNEWGAHVAQIVNHTISPIYLIGWRGVNFDPSAALIAWDCASAFSNHCNPQIQESLKIGLTSVTPHRRAAAYQNALSTYLTDPHAAYVFQEIGLYAVRATVRWTPRVDQVVLVKTVTMQ